MVADKLPAICGSETLTTVVSSTSIKVLSMTAMATIQGLTLVGGDCCESSGMRHRRRQIGPRNSPPDRIMEDAKNGRFFCQIFSEEPTGSRKPGVFRRGVHDTVICRLPNLRGLSDSGQVSAPFLIGATLTVLLVAVAFGLALAHALELPGKMRVGRDTYLAVQTIYYPGFTIGGGVGEAGGILATFLFLFFTPYGSAQFWLTLAALAGLIAMQAVFWLITQPVNRFWAAGTKARTHGLGIFFDRSEEGAR